MYNYDSKTIINTSRFWMGTLVCLPLITSLSACGVTGDAGSGASEGIIEFPIAYVKRTIPLEDDGSQMQVDVRDPLLSSPGGDLYIKERSSLGATERNITGSITNGMGDVKDLNVSYDGKTIVFALKPEDLDPNDNEEPKWDLYTYNIESDELKPVMGDDDISAGVGDDIAPHFLPDGRIVFSSNRQSKSREVLLNQFGKAYSSVVEERQVRSKALVLHVINPIDLEIKQLTFNQSHDLDASVLNNGRILFSRWDRINNSNEISLYTILQDGTQLQPYYGTHDESHPEVSENNHLHMLQARELSDGRVIMLFQPYEDTFGGGDIVIVDAANFVDLNQTTYANKGAISGSALQKATNTNVVMGGGLPLKGRYSSVYPLKDGTNRMIVSKGICQTGEDISTVMDVVQIKSYFCADRPDLPEAFPAYGIWMYDRNNHTEKPLVKTSTGIYITDAVAVQPSEKPTETTPTILDPILEIEKVGILNIRSVYDIDGSFNTCLINPGCATPVATDPLTLGDPAIITADQREARFIRIVKAVGIPDRDDPDLVNPPDLSNQAFGPSTSLGMKEIIGYSPIQPDGSVRVKVPADIAFYFDILDKDARRIGPRHENWLQVKPGETLECSGCHTHSVTTPNLPLPHGRADAQAPSANAGAASGYIYPNTLVPGASGAYFAVNDGETMAEVIARTQAAQGLTSSITPSVNVKYTDVWTDDVNLSTGTNPRMLTKAPDINYVYSSFTNADNVDIEGLDPTLSTPASSTCESGWSASCRILINYEDHIQPIWELDRLDAVTNEDVRCTKCHSYKDQVDENIVVLPQAQLNLEKGVPSNPFGADEGNGQQYESYRELMFDDAEQQVLLNALDDIEIPRLDDNGDQIIIDGEPQFDTIRVPRSISTAGARFSYFIEKMTETELNATRDLVTTVNHANMLTPAELRLISEWIDIGGQNFNDPFDSDAPQRN